MRYIALAVDFDGTIARDGRVDDVTVAALIRVRATGRRLILVTGREIPDLLRCFAHTEQFDLIVAENGGLLFDPATRSERLLAQSPPSLLVDSLRARGVDPISVGRVVVATWQPHEAAVIETIHALGLEYHVSFNKGAVMLLPPSVNKATGLAAALRALHLSSHNVVAIGDAENDHALFDMAECSVAVANALPSVKAHADYSTSGDHGAGVVEVIDGLIENDLEAQDSLIRRHDIHLGTDPNGRVVMLPAHGANILIAGTSGSGKSTIVAGLLERIAEAGYQYCVVDPEGDYEAMPNAVISGDAQRPPTVGDVMRLLERPDQSAVVNLLAVPLGDRPAFFAELQSSLLALRARVGRPHWIVVDEAHHLLPIWGRAGLPILSPNLGETILVTVDPCHVVPDALSRMGILLATGSSAEATMASFCRSVGEISLPMPTTDLAVGEALIWRRDGRSDPVRLHLAPTETMMHRHRRKYAQGEIDPLHSFYFRGPGDRSSIRASSLLRFAEISEHIDDETWLYHLQRGDFARWFRDVIKDDVLVVEADRGAALTHAAIAESREVVRQAIERRYTLPE